MIINIVYLAFCGLLIFISYILWRKFLEIKIEPDPWEKEGIKIDEDDLGLCVNCLTPIKNKHQHYCPKCGFVTGEYTRYIPYINIRFNYSIFALIAKKMRII